MRSCLSNAVVVKDPDDLTLLESCCEAATACCRRILVTELAAHTDQLKADSTAKFTAEYESIEPGQQFTWDNSSMDINKPKNR